MAAGEAIAEYTTTGLSDGAYDSLLQTILSDHASILDLVGRKAANKLAKNVAYAARSQ